MRDQPGATKGGICRRSVLKGVPMIAGAIITASAIPNSVFAQTKVSHEIAKYQDQPKNGQQGSTCVQFEPPSLSARSWRAQSVRTVGAQLYMAKPT